MNLKGLRASVNKTQAEVAESIGISRDTYRRIEKGDTDLSLDNGYKLSDLFDVSIDAIYQAYRATKGI